MKITELDWIAYDASGDDADEPNIHYLLRVRTDAGPGGVAQANWGGPGDRGDRERAREMLLGKDPLTRDDIWQALWDAGVRGFVQSMIDIALWDLYGRAEGKRIHELLGARRDRVPAYVSSPFNVGGGCPEAYAEAALEVRERGFQGYKIHPTHNDKWSPGEAAGDVETDVAIARAVRDAIGEDEDFILAWDNYHTYDCETALRVGRVLAELGYAWYESPTWEREEDMGAYVKLCEELEIPVCAPETNDGAHFSRLRWMEAGACDINRIDFMYGGVTSCLKVARACEKVGMPLDLHTGHYSHLQVMGTTARGTIPYFEHYGTSPSVQFEDGCAVVPAAPGMGLDPGWDYINARRVV